MHRNRFTRGACLIAVLAAAFTGAHAAPTPAGPEILVTFAADAQPPGRRVGSGFKGYAGGGYATRPTTRYLTRSLAADYALQVVDDWPIEVLGVHCVVYRVSRANDVDRLLGALNNDPRIDSAQRMQHFRLQSTDDTTPVSYNDPYHDLQRAWRETSLDRAHRLSTGRNVRVAVIDTAVEQRHPDLRKTMAGFERFVPDERNTTTGDFHGTAVAGVIAAEPNNNVGIVGVAPEARLFSLETCWPDPQGGAECNSFTLAKALSWAIKEQMHVINLSLAGPEDALLGRLVAAAVERGIAVVAADSPEAGMRFPASMAGVIAVRTDDTGAPDPPGVDTPAFYAPGRDMLTTVPNEAYDFVSGSSMATAYTTGLVALIRAYAPSLPPERIRSRLLERVHNTAAGDSPPPVNACTLLAGLRSPADATLSCPPVLVSR